MEGPHEDLTPLEKEFARDDAPLRIGSDTSNIERVKPDVSSLDTSKVAHDPKEFVEDLIANRPLCLFSRSGSPRSSGMKRLLNRMEAEFEVVDLDLRGDTPTIEQILQDKCQGKSLPILFMGGVPFDANDLKAAHDDKSLEQRIRNAGGFQRKDMTTPNLTVPNRINEDVVPES